MSVGHLVNVLLIVYNSTEHVTQKTQRYGGHAICERAK